MLDLMSRRDIRIFPDCKDNSSYLQAVMDTFFEKKDQFIRIYTKITGEEPKIIEVPEA